MASNDTPSATTRLLADIDQGVADGTGGVTAPKTDAAGTPQSPKKSSTATRPVQVAGDYPVRQVTWYQINTSDIRSVGVAQAAATVFAAIGTFALSSYLDFSKDITLAEETGQGAPEFLQTVASLSFWAWIVFWVIAALAFFWQRNELSRIKAEHGELTFWGKVKKWGTDIGSR